MYRKVLYFNRRKLDQNIMQSYAIRIILFTHFLLFLLFTHRRIKKFPSICLVSHIIIYRIRVYPVTFVAYVIGSYPTNSDNRLIQWELSRSRRDRWKFPSNEWNGSVSIGNISFPSRNGHCAIITYICCVGGLIDRRFESSQSLRFTRRGHAMVMLAGEKIVTSAVRTMADSTCGPAIPATGNH